MASISVIGYGNDVKHSTSVECLINKLLSNDSNHIIELFDIVQDDYLTYVNDKISKSLCEFFLILKHDETCTGVCIYTDVPEHALVLDLKDSLSATISDSIEGIVFNNKHKHYEVSCIIEGNINEQTINNIYSAFSAAVPDAFSYGWFKNEIGWWYKCNQKYIKERASNVKINEKTPYVRYNGFLSSVKHFFGESYYHLDNGYIATGSFNKVPPKDNIYYSLEDGELANGWIKINDKWHLFTSNGASATAVISNKLYVLNEYGMLNEDADQFELVDGWLIRKGDVI